MTSEPSIPHERARCYALHSAASRLRRRAELAGLPLASSAAGAWATSGVVVEVDCDGGALLVHWHRAPGGPPRALDVAALVARCAVDLGLRPVGGRLVLAGDQVATGPAPAPPAGPRRQRPGKAPGRPAPLARPERRAGGAERAGGATAARRTQLEVRGVERAGGGGW